MAKVIVEFTGSWRGYGKGEVAGFEEGVAQSLVDGGRAQLYDKKGAKSGGAKGKAGAVTKEPTQPGPSSGAAPDGGDNTTAPDDDDLKP
ncbi:hypothetical protein [Pseudomonas putida]|uniref:Uncharacterized protein n=1 Tax=Pseudomonas putida TaxID=303 RepID=A0A6S5THZ7_PSEPU|nr:hypothetical protein [Pseudomonas putida]BBT38927.1 hypothetical protein WP8W18C01_12680 [Pseudomonas putida]